MLSLSHVNKVFFPGSVNEKHALTDVSLNIADGDFITVIGGNGAGKSTLLSVVAGVFPGTSRSGATIIGGLFFGLSRRAAAEFSFFLAIPTLIGATIYQLYKERALLSLDDVGLWAVGFISAFVSAFLCVRWLLRFISNHDLTPFAWYRIAFGIVVLLTWQFDLIAWTA